MVGFHRKQIDFQTRLLQTLFWQSKQVFNLLAAVALEEPGAVAFTEAADDARRSGNPDGGGGEI